MLAQCGPPTLSEAEENYNIGRFDRCIGALNTCLDQKGFNYDERVQAYRLIAMSYLAVDSLKEADTAIGRLLVLKDNFEPDPRDADRFRLEVQYVRTLMRSNLISSVSKKAERIELAPATVQIITAEDIRNRGYEAIESIFYDLPGFDISRTYGLTYSTLYQRGYRSSALTDRTLILVDGVEDNELWSNGTYLSRQYPISNIKRIEVIYGPASTIYGANAFTGVVNIVTKGEGDYFAAERSQANKETNVAFKVNTGIASFKSRHFDATAALKHKNVFFSVTGKLFHTDEFDLSSYSNWDGQVNFDTATYRHRFTQPYNATLAAQYQALDPTNRYFTTDGTTIYPTTAAITRADSFDRAVYRTATNGANRYGNPKKEFYVSSQLQFGDFKLGFQYWNRNEGTASDYTDHFAAINNQFSNWEVRQYFVNARYSKNISDKLVLSSFSYFKSSEFAPNTYTTRYLSYGFGDLSFLNLLNSTAPSFATTYYSQHANQFRSELTANYSINDLFDMVAGVEFRNGILQGDYVKGSIYPAAVYGTTPDSLAGGNNYATYTYGAFSQLNYHNAKKRLNINVGGRFDYNRFRETQGYGSVFNPRLAVIWYPSNFIFKAIYSEAFLDASSFNKFSTSATRLLNNPTLEPEKVRNIEVTARYGNRTSYVEIAAYRAYYNNILQTAIVTLPSGGTTSQFQASGEARIQGIQLAAQATINRYLTATANFSITDPKSVVSAGDGSDSLVRFGDISKYSFNAAVNARLLRDRINLNLRTNIVGDKPTGSGTTITSNPNNKINGFALLHGTVTVGVIKQLQLQFTCNNILNTAYNSPGIRAADGQQFAAEVPQPERNYHVRLLFDFVNL